MRTLARIGLVLVGILICSAPALAHGGPYPDPRPGDPPVLPPGLREPRLPPPPPPLPPGAGQVMPPTDGSAWWHLNSARFENARWRMYHRMGGGPLFVSGRDGTGRAPQRRLTQKQVLASAIPALLEVLDAPEAYPTVRAAALVALAKITREDAHARKIAEALGAPGDVQVEEAAALALGLLRRAEREARFPGALLDEMREVLLTVLADGERAIRVRGAAALALGLLADQPVGEESGAVGRVATCARLTSLLQAELRDPELAVPLLLAISLQPPETFSAPQLDFLFDVARGEGTTPAPGDDVRAWALQALGRVGRFAHLEPIVRMKGPLPATVLRARVLAIARLGLRGSDEERHQAAVYLLEPSRAERDDTERRLALLAFGRILAADLREGVDPIERHFALLRRLWWNGEWTARPLDRPVSAIALGIAAREIHDGLEIERVLAWRSDFLAAMRTVVADATADPRHRAACCIGLGIARDAEARTVLVDVLRTSEDQQLAANAAWSLGLLDLPSPEIATALDDAMRKGPPLVRQRAFRAFALLGHPWIPGRRYDAVEHLLGRLAAAPGPHERNEAIRMLGRFGDHRAIPPLVRLLRDEMEEALVRARAAAALGGVGDLELLPSLDRLRAHANHRSLTDVLRRAFGHL